MNNDIELLDSHKEIRLKFSTELSRNLNICLIPIPDGNIHRFDDPGGSLGNLSCWYVLNLDPSPHGAYGNWRTGEKFGFRFGQSSSLSPIQRADLDRGIRLFKESIEKKKLLSQSLAAHSAWHLWNTGTPANQEHPYLRRKNISSHSLKEFNSKLLVPLVDKNGQLANVQSISSDGEKRFMQGCRVKGCYSLIGSINPSESIYICEGWATGATLHEITNLPVACAMNCGNLLAVGKSIRGRFPDLSLTVAGDDDRKTKGNPGLTAAIAAASELSSSVIAPEWPSEAPLELSDFNDLYCWSVNHGSI